MTCFCLCHNSYSREQGKAPHDEMECACMHVEDNSLRARIEITAQIEEQLLQKAVFEEALKEIADNSTDDDAKARARKALEPTILCVACRKLTPAFPCAHCGKE